MKRTPIKIGINARLFPANWRPVREEIEFSQAHGFQSIQFAPRDRPLSKEFLGDSLDVVANALDVANLDLTVELAIAVNNNGRTENDETPLDILEANLSAIEILRCRYVHWHIFPIASLHADSPSGLDPDAIQVLEHTLIPQFKAGVELAENYGFTFGVEHNEPDLLLFSTPQRCRKLMDAVPGLKFVWDINHTIPEHLPGFQALVSEASIIHVSDTALPDVNYHLPLGLGTIDLENTAATLLEQRFVGPAILEIGGLMKSGGYGRDTDTALIDSQRRFQAAIDEQAVNSMQ